MRVITTQSTTGYDPHAGASGIIVEPTYSTLWLQKAGFLARASGEIVGDLAESSEYSPDRLTLTVKLTPKAHFSPLAPTNGRAVDAHDVVFSWERVLSISPQAGNLATSVNPQAPIESISAIDDQTVQIRMSHPDATLLALLSSNFQGYLNIAPKEGADPGVLDIRTTTRGSGPWFLERDDDGQRAFKRNPGFGQDPDLPYLDEFTEFIVPEYASALAQFRNGSAYTFAQISTEDIVSAKKDLPALEVRQAVLGTSRMRPFFGLQPGSPFVDERVRQAFVHTWDRELYTDVMFNKAEFEREGMAVDTLWETAIQASNWDGWVIDGRSDEFGPNSKYLDFDIEEARKLLSAAGVSGVVSFTAHSPTNLGGQPIVDRLVEVILGMAEDSGLFRTADRRTAPWTPTWIQEYHSARAEMHEGVAFTQSSIVLDPVNEAALWYHPSSGNSKGTDDVIAGLIDRAKVEFDDDRRRELIRDLQRHEAKSAYFPRITGASGFTITWPAMRNVNVWQGGTPHRRNATIFLDPSKPPLA